MVGGSSCYLEQQRSQELAMWEFNIQPAAGGWFHYPEGAELDCSIFQPLHYPSKVIEGRDVCYIEVEGCEVSFSDEMHGVHVAFETGDISEELAQRIVESIGERLATLTGQPTVVYPS
jgi:hypothetical protein